MSRMKIEQTASPYYLENKLNNGYDQWKLYFETDEDRDKACKQFWSAWRRLPEGKQITVLRTGSTRSVDFTDVEKEYLLYLRRPVNCINNNAEKLSTN